MGWRQLFSNIGLYVKARKHMAAQKEVHGFYSWKADNTDDLGLDSKLQG